MSATSNPVAEAVGLPEAPVLVTRAARDSGMAFLELDCARRNAGVTGTVREDAFLIALQLTSCGDFDLYADSRAIRPRDFDAGAVAIFDLRMGLATDLRDPFHAVNLYLPHATLTALGEDGDIRRGLQDLRHTPGAAVRDPVARHLLLAMRPALARPPAETSELFVDHAALALALHVAGAYGEASGPPVKGGLAPWQERRAKDLIDAHIDGRVTLSSLARACGLSSRQFSRAFRQSTGAAPFQWLRRRRVEHAKQRLAGSSAPLGAIALECGFADQSHFTRVFAAEVGVTPHAWRRARQA